MRRTASLLPATTTALVAGFGGLCGWASASSAAVTGGASPPRVPALSLNPNEPSVPPGHSEAPAVPSSSTLRFSSNWSGYAVTSALPFRDVSTTFLQPTVKCKASGAVSVFWVGLDGWTDGTVEQDGTGALCSGSTPVYFAWWEMFPTNAIQPTMLVAPGDLITESVHYAQGQYVLTVKDHTTHAVSTNVETCGSGLTCSRSSAEWVAERPTLDDGTLAKMPNWGTMAFASGEAGTTLGGSQPISKFNNFAIDMVNRTGTRLLATVGSLNAGTFLDTWDAGG